MVTNPSDPEPSTSGPTDAPETDAGILSRLGKGGAAGIAWTTLGTAGQSFSQLAVLVILARLLSPTDFGIATAAAALAGLVQIFSQLGVGPAIVQRLKIDDAHISTGLAMSLAAGLILGAALFLSADGIEALMGMNGLAPCIRALSIILPFQGLMVVAQALLQRQLRFRFIALCQLVSFCIAYGGVAIALAFAGFGAMAIVYGTVAQMVVQALLYLIGTRHSLNLKVTRAAFADLAWFGGGQTISRLGNYAALQGDNLVVGALLGAASLGLYGRAYQLTSLPASLFAKVVDVVLFPSLTKVQDRPDLLAKVFLSGSATVAFLTLPVSILMCILAPEINDILLGYRWEKLTVCLQILAVSTWFRTSYKMSDSLAISTGHVYQRAWRQVVYALAVVGGAAIGSRWGIAGVATGVSTAIIFNFLIMTQLSLRTLNLTWMAFCKAHAVPLRLGMIVALATAAAAALLRQADAPAPLTLIGAVAGCGLVVLGLAASRSVSGRIYGASGHDLLTKLRPGRRPV